jgi:pimeloyl-ACP methyl ester carboxylesterase
VDSAVARIRRLFRRPSERAPAEDVLIGGEESDEAYLPDDPALDSLPAPPREAPRRDLYYTSGDGLRLHVAEYGDPNGPWLPVVCIPGLSRSFRDFHFLGRRLAGDPERPRRVLAFDLRGRGMSDWDKEIAHYTPLVEMQDVLDGMAALGVGRAVVVGTSRGGLIAMLMGVARPSALAGVVLNDVGPAIEARGLARLKTYVDRTPAPDDWDDAVRILRRLHGRQFTALDDAAWSAFAEMTWRDGEDGRPVSDYDPALARTFDGIEFDRPMPTLWPEFAALRTLPVLAIRGETSDILSPGTLARMAAEHGRMEQLEVPGEGHAPVLIGAPLIERIAHFVDGCERNDAGIDAITSRRGEADDDDGPPPDGRRA